MIKMWWYTHEVNFGDRLSKIIVERMTGDTVELVRHNVPNKLLAIGSILGMGAVVPGDSIWGSGYLNCGVPLPRNVKVTAVRGPVTRQMLLAQGVACPEVYGDPAILLPELYTPKPLKKVKVGVLPHINDAWLDRRADICIDAKADPLDVVDQICSCEILVTSALHGVIVAEAYGIPVMLVRSSAHMRGEPPLKYGDYFLSTGRDTFCLVDASVELAAQMALMAPKPKFQKDALRNAFWELFPEKKK
jgi:pyruvyltransferase